MKWVLASAMVAGLLVVRVPAESWEAVTLGGLGINADGRIAAPAAPRQRACCLEESCLVVTHFECGNLQGSWREDQEVCDPNPCLWGSCCMGGVCEVTWEASCLEVGGAWVGSVPNCYPNPCPAVCCLPTGCEIMLRAECLPLGRWHPEWSACDPNPCYGVCCYGQVCDITTEDVCARGGGAWHPEWITCDPNPCGIPNPVQEMSWGRIKHLLR